MIKLFRGAYTIDKNMVYSLLMAKIKTENCRHTEKRNKKEVLAYPGFYRTNQLTRLYLSFIPNGFEYGCLIFRNTGIDKAWI